MKQGVLAFEVCEALEQIANHKCASSNYDSMHVLACATWL